MTTPSIDDFRSNVSFICGASIHAVGHSVVITPRAVSLSPPDTEFSKAEIPINLDLKNRGSYASGDFTSFDPKINPSNNTSNERIGMLEGLSRILWENWTVPEDKAISGSLHITYGVAVSTANRSLWQLGLVRIPYVSAEMVVSQMIECAFRLLILSLFISV